MYAYAVAAECAVPHPIFARKAEQGHFDVDTDGIDRAVVTKVIMPGKDPAGFIVTILIGIAGAFVGGFIGSALGLGTITGFNLDSLLLKIGAAILLLIIYRAIKQ